LVAIMILPRWALGSCLSASPRTRSDLPNPWACAVSNIVMPSSSAWRIEACASRNSKLPPVPVLCEKSRRRRIT
jgi:hypothetical protein